MIIRLYEISGNHTTTKLDLSFVVEKIVETNLLENPKQSISLDSPISFTPFEIKTLKMKVKSSS